MMDSIKGWLTSILVTVIFMTIVDMILPSNNMKKYVKLVTGLIIIITILSPVFKIFNKQVRMEEYIAQYTSKLEGHKTSINNDEIKREINKNTIETFKENLKKSMENAIYDLTGKKYQVTGINMVEDTNSIEFSKINYLELKRIYGNGDIKPVENIAIGEKEKVEAEPADKKTLDILKEKFGINSSVVKFVK